MDTLTNEDRYCAASPVEYIAHNLIIFKLICLCKKACELSFVFSHIHSNEQIQYIVILDMSKTPDTRTGTRKISERKGVDEFRNNVLFKFQLIKLVLLLSHVLVIC